MQEKTANLNGWNGIGSGKNFNWKDFNTGYVTETKAYGLRELIIEEIQFIYLHQPITMICRLWCNSRKYGKSKVFLN